MVQTKDRARGRPQVPNEKAGSNATGLSWAYSLIEVAERCEFDRTSSKLLGKI